MTGSQGEKGDPGPQGPAGSISVYSAADEYLGIVGDVSSYRTYIYLPSLKAFFDIIGETGLNMYDGVTLNSVKYTEPGCAGDAYATTGYPGNMRSFVFSVSTGVGQTKHYMQSGEPRSVTCYSYRSYTDDFPCQELVDGETGLVTPLTEVILPFTYPVAVPMKFE
jgi:hypothetical protein